MRDTSLQKSFPSQAKRYLRTQAYARFAQGFRFSFADTLDFISLTKSLMRLLGYAGESEHLIVVFV